MNKPQDLILVIFGASGDLTERKLVPAIYELFKRNLLPDKFAVVGVSRTNFTDEAFRAKLKNAVEKQGNGEKIGEFLKLLHYIKIDTAAESEYSKVKEKLNELKKEMSIGANYIFYLSTPPKFYGIIPKYLADLGLNSQSDGFKRIIIEKPFGYDLESAKELNKILSQDYEEDQLYRIDHYLGKETVQNVLVTRFSNGIFEPLWNRNYIHHVEITAAEEIGVENRGGYYDESGALRDMLQNHLLQLVGLVAMEPPASLDSESLRNEALKVFRSLRPIKPEEVNKYSIRGQYIASKIKGELVKGYREEKGVNFESRTETYAALKFYIDNWRWGGVPFYIRTGKRLPTHVTEIVIHFKPTPHYLFSVSGQSDTCNQLIIRIQPDEGILLKFGMKVPGQGFNVQTVNMDFHYADLTNVSLPSAYERLLYDCMMGDSTLFTRGDAVETLWKFLKPIQIAWADDSKIPIYGYPAGTWGPETADSLIEQNMKWHYPCKNLTNDGNYCEL